MACRRLFIAVCVVTAAFLVAWGTDAVAGSMMFRGGPQRTGVTENQGPTTPELEVVWSYRVGSNSDWLCSTPALDETSNLLVFGANDKKVHALNMAGEFLWSYETGGQVYSSPLLEDGRVYIGSLDGKLYSLSYAGEFIWSYETGGPVYSSPVPHSYAGMTPTIVFGSDDGKVHSVSTDGQFAWSYQTQGWVSSSPAVSLTGDIYAASYDGHLYAFDSVGMEKWSFDAGAQIFATPAVGPDGGICFGTLQGTLFKVNSDGSEAWRYDADGPVFGSCSVDRVGDVRFGTIGYTFCHLNASGVLQSSEIRPTTAPVHFLSSAVLDAADRTYVGTLDRDVYCFNSLISKIMWRYDVEQNTAGGFLQQGSGIYASIVLDSQRRFYLPCMNGHIYCFRAGEGRGEAALENGAQDMDPDLRAMHVRSPKDDGDFVSSSSDLSFGPRSIGELKTQDPDAPPTLFDEALKMTGYSYSAIPVDYAPVDRDPYRLDLIEYLLAQDPLQGPSVTRELADELEYECPGLQAKILKEASMADAVVQPVAFSHSFGDNPLEEAIRQVYSRHGRALSFDQETKLGTINGLMGRSIQEALGLLLLAMDEASRLRDEALEGITVSDREKLFTEIMDPNWISNLSPQFAMFDVYKAIDKSKLFEGAAVVADVIDSLTGVSKRGPGWEVKSGAEEGITRLDVEGDVIFSFETPIGSLILGGYGENTYSTSYDYIVSEWPALVVDLGGNDTYAQYLPDHMRESLAASVTIDIGGNDTYQSRFDNAQGSGNLGYGFCIDLIGDDYYEAHSFSQGAGWGGVGVLYDGGGNDRYYGDTCCQGAGFMGIGLMIDKAGNDTYSVDEHGQAFGYVSGVGVLMDGKGNDLYFAGGEYEHMYEPPRTTSMSQGYGFGVRLNYVGDPHASGGVGLLIDSEGDDQFISDFFGTAGAYWFAAGMLLNRGGNDVYMSRQYSIASGIHLAVGILVDDDGDDIYMCRSLSQGCAHDDSIGILVDNAGDDMYLAQDFSQGASSPRSFSALIDNAGNDMYWAMVGHLNQGEGRYDSSRKTSLSLLLDVGGRDFYQIKGYDNSRWTQQIYGVGIDSEFGDSGFH